MSDEAKETDSDSECHSNEDDTVARSLSNEEDLRQNITSEGASGTNKDERSPTKQLESPKKSILKRYQSENEGSPKKSILKRYQSENEGQSQEQRGEQLQEQREEQLQEQMEEQFLEIQVTDHRKREHLQHPGSFEDQVRKKLKKELKESQRPLDPFRQHSSQHVKKSRLSEEKESGERSQNEPQAHCSKDNVYSGFWGTNPQQNQFPQQSSQHLKSKSSGSQSSSQFISPQHQSGFGTSTESMGMNREIPGENFETQGARPKCPRNRFGTSTESMGMNREIPGENLGTEGAHSSSTRKRHKHRRNHTFSEFQTRVPETAFARDLNPGHRRRSSHTFSERQTTELEIAFARRLYPDIDERREIARDIGLTEQQVSDWFKNAQRNLPIKVRNWKICKNNEKSQRDPPTN